MTVKLHQVLAVFKGINAESQSGVTKNYQMLAKTDLFKGATRTYEPLNDDAHRFPNEDAPVKLQVPDLLANVQEYLAKLFNVSYDVEEANQRAKASIVIDGQVLVPDVPVTYLLFLEKKLTDLRTVINALPVLDPSVEWLQQPASGLWMGPEVQTTKTSKVPQVLVKYPATDKHPAQTEVWQKEEPQGTWTSRALSGAIPLPVRKEMQARLTKLIEAVKKARAKANETEAQSSDIGSVVLGYVLNGS